MFPQESLKYTTSAIASGGFRDHIIELVDSISRDGPDTPTVYDIKPKYFNCHFSSLHTSYRPHIHYLRMISYPTSPRTHLNPTTDVQTRGIRMCQFLLLLFSIPCNSM